MSNQAGSVDPPLMEGFLLAHSKISAEKIEAYRNTDYRFGERLDAITLRIGRRSDKLASLYVNSGHTCAAFITACNPFGEAQSKAANDDIHARLGKELRRLSNHVTQGVGTDPSGAWPEEDSFLALGIDLEAAKILGIRYKQDAIVWTDCESEPILILLR